MNYSELREANHLLDKVKEINHTIEVVERAYCIPVLCYGYKMILSNEHKDTILEMLKEFRDEKVKRLEELGVTEE